MDYYVKWLRIEVGPWNCQRYFANITMGHLHWKMKTILENNSLQRNKLSYSEEGINK